MYCINEPHIPISGREGDQPHKGSFERMGGLWLVFSAHNQGFFYPGSNLLMSCSVKWFMQIAEG